MKFLAAALLIVLSGCAGQPTKAPTGEAGDAPQDGTNTILEGWVTDDEQIPVIDAEVLIQGMPDARLTNGEGGYRFLDLPAGEYLLNVTKVGYLAATEFATVRDGFATVLNFTLEVDLGLKPYSRTELFEGQLSCQVFVGDDPETGTFHDCGEGTPTHQPEHLFEVPSDAVQILLEVFWTPSTEAARELLLVAETVGLGSQNARFVQQSGTSGQRAWINSANLEFYYYQGGQLHVEMSAGDSVGNPTNRAFVGATIQQDFQVYATFFFVQPGPEDFTAGPEAPPT